MVFNVSGYQRVPGGDGHIKKGKRLKVKNCFLREKRTQEERKFVILKHYTDK